MYIRKLYEPEKKHLLQIPGHGTASTGGSTQQEVWGKTTKSQNNRQTTKSGLPTLNTSNRKSETEVRSGTFSAVPLKNPYDMRQKYPAAEETFAKTELPSVRQTLEQRVSETRTRLDYLNTQRKQIPTVTKPTILDVALNPFGASSAAPTKDMRAYAEELDGKISETERTLNMYNALLDYTIMSEDMEDFATWSQEDQALLKEYIAWDPVQSGMSSSVSGGALEVVDISSLNKRYGPQRVREMIESVGRSQNAEILKTVQEDIDEMAEKGGYWNFVPSVAASLGSGFTNLYGIVGANLNSTGRYSTTDPNQLGQILSMYANTVTEHNSKTFGKDILGLLEYISVAGTMAQGEKGAPTNFQPQVYDALAGTKVQEVIDTGGAFLYKGTKSAADSLVRNYVGALAGGPVGKAISLGLAAVGSFGDSYNDATRKGATPTEAVALAVVDAGTEVLTEFIPLDDWWDLAKKNSKVATDLATDIFAYSGIEIATEEIGLIVTASAEYAILGERSEYAVLARNLMENSGYTREEAERAAFHAFLEDALETAAVSGISADLSIGGARTVEALTGRDGSGQTENGSGNTLPGTDIRFLLPTYQDMVAELESIGMSREEAEAEILTVTREVGEELGISGTLTSAGIRGAEVLTRVQETQAPQTAPQKILLPQQDAQEPYLTTDQRTGEQEGLWTEPDPRTADTGIDMDSVYGTDITRDIDTETNVDTDAPRIVMPDAQLTTPRQRKPQTKEQIISELAPKIRTPGMTSGKATIAAEQMYAKAMERFGDDVDAILEAFQPDQDPGKYLDGFQNAYLSGKMGNRSALKNSGVAAYLTDGQRELAFAMGAQAAGMGSDYGDMRTIKGALQYLRETAQGKKSGGGQEALPPPLDMFPENDIMDKTRNRQKRHFWNIMSRQKGIPQDYLRMLTERFDKGTDLGKKVFLKYVTSDSVADFAEKGRNRFSRKDKKVYINAKRDMTDLRGPGTGFFHEHGHYIDRKKATGSSIRIQVSPRDFIFEDLLRGDFDTYYRAALQRYGGNQMNIYSKITDEIMAPGYHAISDLFGGLTDNQCSGKYRHKAEDWEEEGSLAREAFAHMFAAQFDSEKHRIMETFFPTALVYFEEMLEDLL